MNDIFEPVVTISLAVVALATVAVLVSKNANTAGVIKSYGSAFSSMVSSATAPVTGPASTPAFGAFSAPLLGGGVYAF